MYDFITPREHYITVRDRNTNNARRNRIWNMNVINKAILNQKPNEDVFVTKYPTGKLIKYIILDFDSEENRDVAYKDVTRMKNYLERKGHNSVIVDSTNKGYHLYIQIAPFLFEDTEMRQIPDWKLFFNKFVGYIVSRCARAKSFSTQDIINTNAGMGGIIRLIGSIHPSTQKRVEIIDGEFKEIQEPTWLQDKAQRIAYQFCEVSEDIKQRKVTRTKVVNGVDPIEENDLREIMPEIFNEEIKIYDKGYGYMRCPFHNDRSPSLLVLKTHFNCASCGAKGNIWTLKKKGLVEFGIDGKVTNR